MDNNIMPTVSQTEPTQTPPIDPPEDQGKADKKSIKMILKLNWKIIIVAVVIIALVVLAYIYKGLLIAATVDGSPISRLAIIQRLERDSGKDLLDSLINEKLVQHEAVAKKIVISNDQVSEEIKKIEAQITAQGGTLEAALASQNMTLNDLKKRILFQKEMEVMLAEKVNVTDEEVAQYIIDNKISVPEGQETVANSQIKTELRNQKLNKEAPGLITALKAKAKIQYFVNY